MWLFYVLIILTLFFAYFIKTTKPKGAKQYLKIIFSILAILMMFRGISVGNDTDTYTYIFNDINFYSDYYSNIASVLVDTRYETGFVLLNRLIGILFHHVQWLFIFTGAFVAFSFGRYFYQYSLMPWLSVFMFLTLQFFDLSMSSLRQVLAIAVLMFAYDYLVQRKFVPFVLSVLIASSLHSSSVFFLLLYFFSTKKLTARSLFVSGFGVVVIFGIFSQLFNIMQLLFPQYIHYLTQSTGSYSNEAKLANVLMLLLYLFLFIVIFKLDGKRKPITSVDTSVNNDNRIATNFYDMTTNTHKIAIWLSVMMLFLSLQGTILNRFKFIFGFPLLVAFPSVLYYYKNQKNKFFIQLFSCVIFFIYIVIIYYYRPEWQSTYPYTFFWNEPY